jgi:hypothetical protein
MRTVEWDGRNVALDGPIRVPEPLSGDVYAYARALLCIAELTDVKVVGMFNRVDLLVVPDDTVAGIVDAYARSRTEVARGRTTHIGDDTDYFPGRDQEPPAKPDLRWVHHDGSACDDGPTDRTRSYACLKHGRYLHLAGRPVRDSGAPGVTP